MGNITIDEAARYLGVTTRTISTYISQGIITYHKKQGSNRKYIRAEDLEDLKEATASGEFSIKKFRELRARVKRLEANMGVLMRILDTNQLPLGLTEEEAKELFEAAVMTLDSPLSIEHVEAWLPLFMRLTENDFRSVEEVLSTKEPWKPFLDLCVSMIVYLVGSKEYATSLHLQRLHQELAEGRRRLRLSALLLIEERGPSIEIDKLTVQHPDSTIDIVKKVIKSRHK